MYETEWREIDDFPGYSVSDSGLVRNNETEYILCRQRNQAGLVHVGITRERIQYKRSVALLVADAFLPIKPALAFNTPINLDGDRANNHVSNLLWRPRWFAVKYYRQFRLGRAKLTRPIEETRTQERFEDSWDAALTYGLLDTDIFSAVVNHTYVWPTYQHFRVLHRAA